jgi:hypothetical protein
MKRAETEKFPLETAHRGPERERLTHFPLPTIGQEAIAVMELGIDISGHRSRKAALSIAAMRTASIKASKTRLIFALFRRRTPSHYKEPE